MENIDNYIDIIENVLTLMVLIAAITPTDKDNGVVDRLKNIFKKLTGRK